MEFAAGRSFSDPALDTLLLPLAQGVLPSPPGDRVLFLRARCPSPLPPQARDWRCEQGFRPAAEQLRRAGLSVEPRVDAGGPYDLVLLLAPRQRQESRALLTRALAFAGDNGSLLVSALNDEGARSVQVDLERLAGPVRSLSKNRCRAFWSVPATRVVDAALREEWAEADAPRPIAGGRFISRPGLFAWDRIDVASELLAACLPPDLRGDGADFGAGYGFLSVEVLNRCPGVTALDLFEAEFRALELARVNLAGQRRAGDPVAMQFHWHDVAAGVPGRYDFVVCNPPFHEGRADQPDLGRAFIAAAAEALKPGGRLWLVANRHLPYEATLAANFPRLRVVREAQGFKVIEATRTET